MDRRVLQESSDLFRGILRHLRSDTGWEPDLAYGHVDREIDAVRNDDKTRGELFYTHTDLPARVTVSFPAYQTGDAMTILLDDPLDSQLQHSDEGFVGRLGATHQAIAQRHDTAYLDPIADPSLIARVRVPLEYDESTLTRTMQSLAAIATETARLHEDLTGTLEAYQTGPLDGDGLE